jgi:hypothetical protein
MLRKLKVYLTNSRICTGYAQQAKHAGAFSGKTGDGLAELYEGARH